MKRGLLFWGAAGILLIGGVAALPQPAGAAGTMPICGSCSAMEDWHTVLQAVIRKEHRNSRKFISRQFDDNWDDDGDGAWDEAVLENSWAEKDDKFNSKHDHEGQDGGKSKYIFMTCKGDGWSDDCKNNELAFDYDDECRHASKSEADLICWNTTEGGTNGSKEVTGLKSLAGNLIVDDSIPWLPEEEEEWVDRDGDGLLDDPRDWPPITVAPPLDFPVVYDEYGNPIGAEVPDPGPDEPETPVEEEEKDTRAECTTLDMNNPANWGKTSDCLYVPKDPKDLLLNVVWPKIPPYLVRMTHQMSVAAMHQAALIGMMIDGKQQMEVQRTLQELTARAGKEYQPSMGMCTLGTAVRGLHSSEALETATMSSLSRWTQSRQTGSAGTSAASGDSFDQANRFVQFRSVYCNPQDNNGKMKAMCGAGGPADSMNKDIDFARTLGDVPSLSVNIPEGGAATPDRRDVLALASNLYGHKVPPRIPDESLKNRNNREIIMDIRSLIAKRNVAAASYNAIVAMKASGLPSDPADTSFDNMGRVLSAVVQQIGVPPAQAAAMVGANPSYYARMDVLTKRMYQDPQFYVDLYDTPANVGRKKVALQAIGLMQDFDTLQSYLRTEMMLSLMLEMEVIKLQVQAQAARDTMRSE